MKLLHDIVWIISYCLFALSFFMLIMYSIAEIDEEDKDYIKILNKRRKMSTVVMIMSSLLIFFI